MQKEMSLFSDLLQALELFRKMVHISVLLTKKDIYSKATLINLFNLSIGMAKLQISASAVTTHETGIQILCASSSNRVEWCTPLYFKILCYFAYLIVGLNIDVLQIPNLLVAELNTLKLCCT
jgi:hypothetical protein